MGTRVNMGSLVDYLLLLSVVLSVSLRAALALKQYFIPTLCCVPMNRRLESTSRSGWHLYVGRVGDKYTQSIPPPMAWLSADKISRMPTATG